MQYYVDGGVEETGTYLNDQLHGPYLEYHFGGKSFRKYNYIHGKVEGEWIDYYYEGAIRKKIQMVAGLKHGPFQEFHENGKLKQDGNYVEVALMGEVRDYDQDGELTARIFFDKHARDLYKREHYI